MSDESNVAAAPPVGQDLEAVEGRVTALESRVDALEQKGTAVPGGAPEPANPGEDLGRTDSNPELDPHQPGVEPGNAVEGEGAPNAPVTTDPGGNTAPENAPDAPAPEVGGTDVATNPGTGTENTTSGTEVPPEGQATPTPPTDGAPQAGSPDPGATPQPAADLSEKPLYVYVGEDPSYVGPAGYTASGLVTPDGKVLYHYTDDTAGEPATGAIDGELGIYADDAVPAAS